MIIHDKGTIVRSKGCTFKGVSEDLKWGPVSMPDSGTAYAFQTPALPLTRLHHQPQLQNRIATSIEERLILPLKMTQVSLFSTNIRKYGSVSL